MGTALWQTFEPDIYKATAERNVRRLIKIGIIIVVPCIFANLLFILLATPLINILTFGHYTAAAYYAKILSIRNVVTPIYFFISDVIIGFGFSKLVLYNRLVGGVLSVILFEYLILRYKFVGSAWGQTLTMTMMIVISSIMLIFCYKKKDGMFR